MLLLGALTFVGGGWFMTQATEGTSRYGVDIVNFAGWIAMLFFGFCALAILWQMLTLKGPVITLSPAGIRDSRVAAKAIPWRAVASLSTWQHSGQSVMVIGFKPGEEEKLTLSRLARMTRGANARLGADGLCLTATGTTMTHDALMEAAMAYARAHGA